jgi:two-component system, chemotaxis family, response regulator Rcp1
MPATKNLRHVLVVEDNPGDAFLIKKAVQDNEIRAEITLCTDGESALRLINSMDATAVPDAIILDLALPRIGGIDLLRKLSMRPSFVGVPVMVFTSSPSPADRHRVELLGGVRYVQKPSGLDNFLRTTAKNVREMLAASQDRQSS